METYVVMNLGLGPHGPVRPAGPSVPFVPHGSSLTPQPPYQPQAGLTGTGPISLYVDLTRCGQSPPEQWERIWGNLIWLGTSQDVPRFFQPELCEHIRASLADLFGIV